MIHLEIELPINLEIFNRSGVAMRFVIIVFFSSYAMGAFGFEWENCKKIFHATDQIDFSVTATTSTSQYISSFGKCAMVGGQENRKENFIAQNYDILALDIAKGNGEYLKAYELLSNCKGIKDGFFSNTLKENYLFIYDRVTENSPEIVFKNIETVIQKNKVLSTSCKDKT